MKEYNISDDKSRLDLKLIHQIISNSYWAKGRSFEEVKRSIDNSICYGIYIADKQVGFARVLTDFVTIAYLMDVFIIKEYRGQELSKKLLDEVLLDSRFENVKKWVLATADANTLYKKFGFHEMKN
ncbi:MAG: N-acetyltransferase [Ignavibacteriae bacterium]|nr:MAG: N-acetyltransferase [Ignavibacteriota bacterium]